MEELIVKKICKDKKWYERIGIKIFKRSYVEIYKLGRKDCFNILKNI